MTSTVTMTNKPALLHERTHYRSLLLANPNYFGNLLGSPFAPAISVVGDTTYEEIGDVGYNPQMKQLEAVVYVKQQQGYGGSVCSAGSHEYVRFYASFDDGTTWTDLGMAAFAAFDIAATQQLEYAVSLAFDPAQQICLDEAANIVRIRAILSWNQPPTAGNPGYPPVWGNVVDVHVQLDPAELVGLPALLETVKAKVPSSVLSLFASAEVTLPKAKLPAAQLLGHYAAKGVPNHRALFSELQAAVAKPHAAHALTPELIASAKLDVPAMVSALAATSGDTSFEELVAVGLDPNLDLLVGVIEVKQSAGYDGGLCTPGSLEYVAFWVDWGSGAYEYVGTTSVEVHDISALPAGGLRYAAFLPIDLTTRRKPCGEGAGTARVRAVLSWQTPPSTTNPNQPPYWGNVDDTLINIASGPRVTGDGLIPLIEFVGGAAVHYIDPVTGAPSIDGNGLIQKAPMWTGYPWAYGNAPFGGRIDISGTIVNGGSGTKYRVRRKIQGASDATAVTIANEPAGIPVTLTTWDPVNGMVQTTLSLHPDSNGWFDWQDYSSTHSIQNNILTRWYSNEADDDQIFEVWMEVLNPDGSIGQSDRVPGVFVQVDNSAVTAKLSIDGGGSSGECADFYKGATFTGTFTASARHYGTYGFTVRPPNPAHGATATVTSPTTLPTYPYTADPGVLAGTFSFDTSAMDPCGYALTIDAYDRTNVDSGVTTHGAEWSVGFCVRQPPT